MVFISSKYIFNLRHKDGFINLAADAWSRRSSLLVTMRPIVVSFDSLKAQYTSDSYFGPIWESCVQFGSDLSTST